MKNLLIAFVLLVFAAVPFDLKAQSFTVSPDSGAAGESIQVTVTGSGTHFKPTTSASMVPLVDVKLKQGTQTYVTSSVYLYQLTSNTQLTTSLNLPLTLSSGWYDVSVARLDSAVYTYNQANGFYVKAPIGKIVSVAPTSSYAGQSITLNLTGMSTRFAAPASQYQVSFIRNGSVAFQAQGSSISSQTLLVSAVAIPSNATAGSYDISVTNGTDTYAGSKLFTILSGSPPSIQVSPDSGVAGSTLSVTVTGQNTNFQAAQTACLPIHIKLVSSGTTRYNTAAKKVNSATSMDATLVLTGVPAGVYDLEATGINLDLFTTFTVLPHPSIAPQQQTRDTIAPGANVTIGVRGTGTHFTSIGSAQARADLQNQTRGASTRISASSITVTDDTTLSATFSIPASYSVGLADLLVTEPNGVQDTLRSAAMIAAPAGVASAANISEVTVTPNPTTGSVNFILGITRPAPVTIQIFDAAGHMVAIPCDRTVDQGHPTILWDAHVGAGTYFYEVLIGSDKHTGKLIVR